MGSREQVNRQGLDSDQAGEGSKAGEAGWWIRSRGQRSRQADRGWAAGRIVRKLGIREQAG